MWILESDGDVLNGEAPASRWWGGASPSFAGRLLEPAAASLAVACFEGSYANVGGVDQVVENMAVAVAYLDGRLPPPFAEAERQAVDR